MALPPPPRSRAHPLRADLGPADELEAALLRLPDSEWLRIEKSMLLDKMKAQVDRGPVLIGDPAWDELERAAWEEEQRG